MKYLGATHKFEKDGKRYSVELRDWKAFVNGEAVCEWKNTFNTTKTRALQALKHYHERQKPTR